MSARILACCLAAACGGASAQSGIVTYGLVDMNVGQISNFSPDGKSATRVSSGGMNTSRLGFKGTEDINGGLKAVFQLEMGIAADTGVADNPLFKRQATVGLEGRFGSVLVGRAFTSVYDFMLPYDPMGYAPFYSWAPTGNGSGASKYGMALWFDNLVKYTVTRGGFSFGASYGFGEQVHGGKAAVAANYAHGPWSAVAGWERLEGAPGLNELTTARHVGAMVASGRWRLQAAARDYRHEGAQNHRARLYWAGASYAITEPLTLTGALYYQDERSADADPLMLVLRARYALSKRTDLYLTAARARADNGRRVSLSRDEIGYGSTQRGVVVGIQHRF